ncbi:uncharacterized protein LOC104845781 [Loxodonta africana]|uniref:uncharacterized protein LOC104845781 n=1 Tax=Loxodonta africana TaxID=9785 RepID=UPI0030D05803
MSSRLIFREKMNQSPDSEHSAQKPLGNPEATFAVIMYKTPILLWAHEVWWNSLTAATQQTHRNLPSPTYHPRPGQVRAANECERRPGPTRSPATRPPPTPAPSPVAKTPPPPASVPFKPTVSPPPRPSRSPPGLRGGWSTAPGSPRRPRGPSPLELVTNRGCDRAGQPAEGGSLTVRRGGEQAGPELQGVARSYLTPSVSSVSSSTAAAPAVAAAATFLGSAPAAAASSSTLCSPVFPGALTELRVPSAASPHPQHTRPETSSPTAPAAW